MNLLIINGFMDYDNVFYYFNKYYESEFKITNININKMNDKQITSKLIGLSNEPIIVITWSMGIYYLYKYMDLIYQNISKIIFINPFIKSHYNTAIENINYLNRDYKSFFKNFNKRLYSKKILKEDKKLINKLKEDLKNLNFKDLSILNKNLNYLKNNCLDLISNIKKYKYKNKEIIIWGSNKDKIASYKDSLLLKELIKNSTLILLENKSHGFIYEEFRKVNYDR
ncbi:MAG: hypothetical protein N4A54_10695 [Peptostreptococcaceae bacterium]|jgi:predicted alpha/beta hydrolase family esterase|nr:hypothetical protein [Peptostreptococcaceae bacterium]